MSAVESIILNFVKAELTKNPKLAGSLLEHILEKLKVDPTIAHDVGQVIIEILPIILQSLK